MMDKVPDKKIVSLNFSHVLSFWFLYPWRWDWKVVPKRWERITTLLCVISQKSTDLKMICWCRPWFGSAWSGSALHHEFKTTSHI